MHFWAAKGVGGFRLDAFQFVSKDPAFPELPQGFEKELNKHYGMGPRLHEYLREMHDEVLCHYDIFAVAEGAGSTLEDAHDLVDDHRRELQMVYHFEGMDVGHSLDGFALADFVEIYTRWDQSFAEEGWLSIYLGNHDMPRMVSKFASDLPAYREAAAKMLNTFIMTMRGTPYCYYGDEIGMTNMDFENISAYRDVAAISGYAKAMSEGHDLDAYLKELNFLSRDNARTPMQWSDDPHAGFTTGSPWMPVNDNYPTLNVAIQEINPNSVLSHFRRLTQLRNKSLLLVYGDYRLIAPGHPSICAYTRSLADEQLLVLLNFSAQAAVIDLGGMISGAPLVLINNYDELCNTDHLVELKAFQGVVMRV